MPAASSPSLDSLLHTLSASFSLHARPTVLRTLISTLLNSPHPPAGPALIQSLKFRLLASDITVSLQPFPNLCLPSQLPSSAPPTLALRVDAIVVQVLDIADLTISRGDALEHLEMDERGEAMRGREIIRIVPGENDANTNSSESTSGKSMHKLLLEDAAGRRVWAFELQPVPGIKTNMNVGAKILLRGCTVARGVVLLTPETATVMGGLVEVLQREWMEGRKEGLKAKIQALRSTG